MQSLANIFWLAGKELKSVLGDPVMVVLILWSFIFAVILEASGSGRAKVVFRDAGSGEVFDRFLIYIHDVDRIELQDDELFHDAFTLMVGGDATIYFDLRDTKDHYLQGIGGVSYSLSGQITADELGLIDALAEAIVNVLAGSNNESVAIEALGVGSGEIVALAPSGATLAVPVTVVGPEAITRVEVFGEGQCFVHGIGATAIDRHQAAGLRAFYHEHFLERRQST